MEGRREEERGRGKEEGGGEYRREESERERVREEGTNGAPVPDVILGDIGTPWGAWEAEGNIVEAPCDFGGGSGPDFLEASCEFGRS